MFTDFLDFHGYRSYAFFFLCYTISHYRRVTFILINNQNLNGEWLVVSKVWVLVVLDDPHSHLVAMRNPLRPGGYLKLLV